MVRTTELKPGQMLKRAIYSRLGQRLIAPGVKLTAQLLDALESHGGGVYVEEAQGGPPARSQADVRSHYQRVIERVREGGGTAGPKDARARRAARIRREADEMIAARLPRWDGAPKRVAGAPDNVPIDDSALLDVPDGASLLEHRLERLTAAESIAARLLEGKPAAAEPARPDDPAAQAEELVEGLTDQVSRHAPVYPHVLPMEADESRRHGAQMLATASLAVAMSARLGWSRADVIAAGVAGLFADVGMALLAEDLRGSDRPLDDVARNRVRRHPTWSAALLEEVRGLPLSVRLGVHQHHEREDGSGYPRGLRGAAIHDAAKVVAVADAYAAAVSDRPYRSRTTRFGVMRGLVEEAKRGRLWRDAVRALIQTVGLFPVGSFVQLSDGRVAEVAAAGGAARAARPVVRVWRRDGAGGVTPGEVIDLCSSDWADVRISGDVESRGLERRMAA
jgi:HD-GYP domain-containing protein (c-di-GMP phosphodiesterase class II)